MSAKIRVMSWNVQGEIGIGDTRMQRQLDLLDGHASNVDIFLLQAVNYEGIREGSWNGQLGEFLRYFSNRGYYVAHTGDWAQELRESTVQPHADIEGAHNRCNLVASRWPLKRQPLSLRNRGDGKPRKLDYYYSHFPEKMLVSEIDISGEKRLTADELDIWNVGIINGSNWGEEKLNMLETVYGRVYLQTTKTDTPVLLGGDFNAPKRETADREILPHGRNASQYTRYPFYGDPYYLREGPDTMDAFRFSQRWQLAESRIFNPDLSEWEMRDAYWAAEVSDRESSTIDYTHVVHSGTPSKKRLDHILVSPEFDVYRCELWNGEGTAINGLGPSDHAPVVAELGI